MPPGPIRVPLDYETLAEDLRALAYPARLELLDVLRFPHSVGEIKLTPHRTGPGENPDRPVARPTIQAHLDKLVAVDVVREQQEAEAGRPQRRYLVNPQRLYAIVEDLRRLAVQYAGRGPMGDATGTLAASATLETPQGPRLVLVHGLYEGKAFRLDPAYAKDGGWIIGRKRGLPVSLDYDKYVSLENAVIAPEGGRFSVTDLKESKNGTTVNWAPLPKESPRTLKSGDVIGVGRSLLVFVEG